MNQKKIQTEIPSAYKAADHEDAIYKKWEESGQFQPKKEEKGEKPFVISMPPPNATGTLHLGHATMLTIQDIMTRYQRMKGRPALWLPGTDHASIATQNKVEKLLAEKKVTRHMLGREKFLEEVEKFVKQSQSTIRNQVRKMGSSCDWTREKYTLDPALSKSVQEIFVRMYNDGLIYRGNRIVNWCPRCTSTLADDEVKYKEQKAKFYYLKYGPFVIGTARPETKFLDKIIVVHPKDKRYKKYIGQEVTVPWIEGEVKAKIIADESADPEFGTGAMTITPAHDFIDFEIAKKHNLEVIQIIDENGNLTDKAGSFKGQNGRKAREAIIQKLEEKGLVERIDENYTHNLSICYRCDTPIEPLVSRQWFISVDKKFGKTKKTLKELSLEVVKDKRIKILPDNFEKIYFHWMENLHDWCISRQIWFGHRIPVWYCAGTDACKRECEEPIVQKDAPEKCPHCGSVNLTQDPDTLDTWFSSGLWTFSTLGWPEKTDDLRRFHPTSVLETGYDILFFWVARMILMTMYALDEVPFETVYLHGLVRTREGKKMSKSNPETCIDPLDMIAKYGTDALRLSMIIGSGPGNDIRLYEEKIAGYRNFINKIWNAARFVLMNIEGEKIEEFSEKNLKNIADKWIITKLQKLTKEVAENMENYRFSDAASKIYEFLWSDLCDWYVEMSKGADKNENVLIYVLKNTLKLLHPFVPFISEALWEKLGEENLLIGEKWPEYDKKFIFEKEAAEIELMQKMITEIRKARAEKHIDPAKKIHAIISAGKHKVFFDEKSDVIKKLANLETLEIEEKNKKREGALKLMVDDIEIHLPLEQMLDIEEELERITKEIEDKEKAIQKLSVLLENKNFTEKAPKELVVQENEKKQKWQQEVAKLKEHQKDLEKFQKM